MRVGLTVGLLCVLGLVGCSGGAIGGLNQVGASLGTGDAIGVKLAGVVHGGQQPIAGAQVYLFAAGTTGYGGSGIAASTSNASVSLLTSGTLDTSGGATNGDYYVTTDAGGNFSISGDYTCAAGAQVYLYALGGNPGAGTNSAAGLLAALGNCPAAGNFASATPYVVVNEVSTVTAAYAMAGFATDAVHVGSSGTALALTGIANAFANAANLEALETGVALATTPAGNGIVPQAEVNTLANILASCVNTNGATTGPTNATACYTLFTNALSGGAIGMQPTDTATAAINIAHYPRGNIPSLYSLQVASASFQPALSIAPNDLTVALNYTGGGMSQAAGIAIDGSGDVWVTSGAVNSISKFNSLGAAISGTNGYTGGGLRGPSYGIAIDGSGNVWVANTNYNTLSEFGTSGTAISTSSGYSGGGLNGPYRLAIDGSGNVWVANSGSIPSVSGVSEFSSSGTAISGSSGYVGSGLLQQNGIAVDGSGNVWTELYQGSSISGYNSSGAEVTGSPFTGGGLNEPCCGIAIDSSGNV